MVLTRIKWSLHNCLSLFIFIEEIFTVMTKGFCGAQHVISIGLLVKLTPFTDCTRLTLFIS